MPGWLEAFADANPITTMTDALRALWVGAPAGDDVWLAFLWCFALILLFAGLSIARYRRVNT
jgi:ABC-type polysaccharide/polyol phosphate export permease